MNSLCLGLILLPVLAAAASLPAPTGKLAVGQGSFIWTDEKRIDVLSPDRKAARTISVNVFYPADPSTGTTGSYLPDWPLWLKQIGERRLKETFGSAFDGVAQVTIANRQDASFPKKSGRFPLLIFLPGLGMNTVVYTALLSELASHGFVVLAINPTYEVFAAM